MAGRSSRRRRQVTLVMDALVAQGLLVRVSDGFYKTPEVQEAAQVRDSATTSPVGQGPEEKETP